MGLPIADYLTDTKSVLDNAPRVLQALVDVCGDQGLLNEALLVMDLSKGMCQGVWPDRHPLLALANMTDKELQRIESKVGGLRDCVQVFAKKGPDGVKQVLAAALPQHSIGNALRMLQSLPLVSISCTISPKGLLVAGTSAEATVTVQQGNRYKSGAKAAVRAGLKGRDEGWWLVLGNDEDGELLALKRIRVSGSQAAHKLAFQVPDRSGDYELTVYLICDCYIGLDAGCRITVSVK